MNRFLASLLVLATVAMAAPAGAQAFGDDNARYAGGAKDGRRDYVDPSSRWGQQDEVRQAVREGRSMPLARILEILQRRTPGRMLDASQEWRDGRPAYRVIWDARGRRIEYVVDAATGAILSASGG